MAHVLLKNVKKVFDKDIVAVNEFNLEIEDTEFIVLVGPSGCGKSTTLRMIAGLEEITEGEIYIDDVLVNDVAPKDRNIAMVFQNYALYPHMTVYENMSFGLKLRKIKKTIIEEKVLEAADILDIRDLLKRKPKELSGGQRQRVAIGRAIVRDPKVFLMDEPLSNLDAKLRNSMRTEIIKLRQRLNTTFVYVTHDQVEAMTLGDRIIIMKDGIIQQIGSPQHLFNSPANLFVAGFIGAPQMNFINARLCRHSGVFYIHMLGKEIKLQDSVQEVLSAKNQTDTEVVVGIRPEHISLATIEDKDAFRATLEVSELMGSEIYLHILTNDTEITVRAQTVDLPNEFVSSHTTKIDIYFKLPPRLLHIFDKDTQCNLIL